jgi:hypothetical protein
LPYSLTLSVCPPLVDITLVQSAVDVSAIYHIPLRIIDRVLVKTVVSALYERGDVMTAIDVPLPAWKRFFDGEFRPSLKQELG